MPTLVSTLRPHSVSREEIAYRYPGPTGLVSRILGVIPHSFGLLEVWPPALHSTMVSVPALFDVPAVDLGRSVSPDTRALAAHAASRAFGCSYCTAHTAIMGSVVRGPADAPTIDGRVASVSTPERLDPASRAVVDYGRAVGTMPPDRIEAAVAELESHHDAMDLEAIVLVTVCMGLLNRLFDTLGVPLETAVQEAAGDPLTASAGWSPGKHEQEGDRLDEGERLVTQPRLLMVKEVPAAEAHARRVLADVPKRKGEQRHALQDAAGFVPYWMETLHRGKARRLFVHWMLERMLTGGVDPAVDPGLKATFGWVQARAVGNTILASHMAFLAVRGGVSPGELARVGDRDDRDGSPDDAVAAALALARATAGGATTLEEDLVAALDRHLRPEGIVELVLVAAIVTAMHRYTASIRPDRLAPEVEAFVVEHGALLGLPARS